MPIVPVGPHSYHFSPTLQCPALPLSPSPLSSGFRLKQGLAVLMLSILYKISAYCSPCQTISLYPSGADPLHCILSFQLCLTCLLSLRNGPCFQISFLLLPLVWELLQIASGCHWKKRKKKANCAEWYQLQGAKCEQVAWRWVGAGGRGQGAGGRGQGAGGRGQGQRERTCHLTGKWAHGYERQWLGEQGSAGGDQRTVTHGDGGWGVRRGLKDKDCLLSAWCKR